MPVADAADLAEVARFHTFAEADEHALMLLAVGVECRLAASGGGVGLLVRAAEAETARLQLALYKAESATPPPPRAAGPGPAPRHGGDAALAYVAVLLFLFGADRRGVLGVDWSAAGAAAAGPIRAGEWWRTVTALGLHADLGHLLGNLVAGVALGLLAAQLLGPGLAWLAALLAGAVGNALAAALRAPDQAAVGASTAVFGLLGILAGHRRRSRVVPWRGGIHRWAPLAAGVLLLVMLGTAGERTDVAAHASGLAAGAVIGFGLAQAGEGLPQGPRAQTAYGLLACALLALAWTLALLSYGG